MKAEGSSKTLYQSPEDSNLHSQRYENPESHVDTLLTDFLYLID